MSAAPTPQPAAAHDASLSVAAVAAAVGVAPSTLRTWARRYGLEPSGHRSGLHRRYTESDLSRLQLMRSLARSGLSSREAARRALEAGPDQLAAAALAHRLGDALPAAEVPEPAAPWRPPTPDDLAPAVRVLLATVVRGDARGAAALLRLALRELGAARAFDERVRPVRSALAGVPAPGRGRAHAVLTAAVVSAVGEVSVRREPRNSDPVCVAQLPGRADPAALALAQAAIAERSIAVSVLPLGAGEQEALRRLESVRGLVVLHLRDADDPATLERLRGAAHGSVLLWGNGWVHWPGQPAALADVVRIVEQASTSD